MREQGHERARSSSFRSAQQRARAAYFVGRCDELHDFRRLLNAATTPRLVFVHGAGGIGKSSLLKQFEVVASDAETPFLYLDARHFEPTLEMVDGTVRQALERLDERAPLRVLAIDHVEHLTVHNDWLRREWLSDLPANLLVVLAGRHKPRAGWRADPGIRSLLTEYALDQLDRDAAAVYLTRRHVPREQAVAVERFARGYPLLLALSADQVLREPEHPFELEKLPDLVDSLIRWLLNDVKSETELRALQACATMRRLDEPMLATMLDSADISGQYDWLADQHYVERQRNGLVIHDSVRELIISDLRGRDLEYHHTLIRRAFRYLMANADVKSAHFRVKLVPQMLYALREEPHARRHFTFVEPQYYSDSIATGEIADIASAVERHEGGESRAWFEYWADNPFTEIEVMRGHNRQPVAFALFLTLTKRTLAAGSNDPCLKALAHHLHTYAPLRNSEQILLSRFRMSLADHQALTPAWSEMSARLFGRMFTPGISVFGAVADLAYDWGGAHENADIQLLADSRYEVGDRTCMISAHDLRRESATVWARNSVERMLRQGLACELQPDPVTILEKPAFVKAIQSALRDYHDDRALAQNVLLSSPMLRRYSNQPSAQALRSLLEETSVRLGAHIHELLSRVSFRPAASKQKTLAAELHMSERTLRRRVQQAQDALIEALWQLETRP